MEEVAPLFRTLAKGWEDALDFESQAWLTQDSDKSLFGQANLVGPTELISSWWVCDDERWILDRSYKLEQPKKVHPAEMFHIGGRSQRNRGCFGGWASTKVRGAQIRSEQTSVTRRLSATRRRASGRWTHCDNWTYADWWTYLARWTHSNNRAYISWRTHRDDRAFVA